MGRYSHLTKHPITLVSHLPRQEGWDILSRVCKMWNKPNLHQLLIVQLSRKNHQIQWWLSQQCHMIVVWQSQTLLLIYFQLLPHDQKCYYWSHLGQQCDSSENNKSLLSTSHTRMLKTEVSAHSSSHLHGYHLLYSMHLAHLVDTLQKGK